MFKRKVRKDLCKGRYELLYKSFIKTKKFAKLCEKKLCELCGKKLCGKKKQLNNHKELFLKLLKVFKLTNYLTSLYTL